MARRNPFLDLDQRIIGDIYTSTEVRDNLVALCDDFGSRFGGTEGERQAADFVVRKMTEYGLVDVHREEIPYNGWNRGEARLEILSPIQKVIPCISLPQSPPANLEGLIIDMEDGAPEEFDRRVDEIQGKIVMTTSVASPRGSKRWIHRGEKYGRTMLAGGIGFVFVNHYEGYGPATGSLGEHAQIPGVSICMEDGAFIQRLMERKGDLRIRLTTLDRSQPMLSWNLVGDLPGQRQPNEIVMLGCHYDGHDISQGAGDPASGAVAVLEAGRVLAKHAPELARTVRFVLWGIEEIGLLGSQEYVRAHADTLSDIRFYLNMDAAGTPTNKRDIVLNEWPELASLFARWSKEMALGFAVGQMTSAHSDHFPFFMAGVPTGGMQSAERSLTGRGYGHTQYDTVDKVEVTGMREAAALAARLAARMANEEQWPAERRSTEKVMALLDGPEYRDEQDLRERLQAYYEQHKS